MHDKCKALKNGLEIPKKFFFKYFDAKNNRLITSGLQRFFPKFPKMKFGSVPNCGFQNVLGFGFVLFKGGFAAPQDGLVAVGMAGLGV